MIGPDQAPTHAAVLELREERIVVNEAYEFLDEKRLLLAAEILRQLDRYEQLAIRIEALSRTANERLKAAIGRHGLQGLSVYPAASLEGVPFKTGSRNFMGVTLVDTDMAVPQPDAGSMRIASNPSTEADQCRDAFQQLLKQVTLQAGVSGNLYRLLTEYRVTERRARALENVILPEIEQTLKVMTGHLEELDFEDAMRVRLQARK